MYAGIRSARDIAPTLTKQGQFMERLALGYSLIALMVAAILGAVIYIRRNSREQTDLRRRHKDEILYQQRLQQKADKAELEQRPE